MIVKLVDIGDACNRVLEYVETHGVSSFFEQLPKTVTIKADDKGKAVKIKITMPQLLYLIISTISGGSGEIVNINPAPNPFSESAGYIGDFEEKEYKRIARGLKKFIDKEKRLPNFVTATVISYNGENYEKIIKKVALSSITYLFVNIVDFFINNKIYPVKIGSMPCWWAKE